MSYATYLPVTQDILDLHQTGKRFAPVRDYQALDHRLNDGTAIIPDAQVADSIVQAAAGGLTIPVVISEGSYRLRADVEEAKRLRSEVFAASCAQQGHDGNERVNSRCSDCGKDSEGTMHYAPSATGWATPVLFIGDCCEG